MFKPLPIFIGLRYTRAKRRNHFVSFISLTSMIGLTLGVAVLIVVLSVMNGFDRELRQRILGMVPHAALFAADGAINDWQALATLVEDNPLVEATAPFSQLNGMLTANGRVAPAAVNGILPAAEQQVSILHQHMQEGALSSLAPGAFNIVLGELVARKLAVQVGDRVTLVLPEASISPAGLLPRLKRFEVSAIFSVGAELDAQLGFIHLDDARRLLKLSGEAQGLRIKTTDLFQAPYLVWDLVTSIPGRIKGTDWTRQHGNLFQAIKLEKTMIGLLLTMIVAVAAFNIVSTLVMVVTDKQANIAILRTMGASAAMIRWVFIVQGTLIGLVGTLMGTALGVLLALTISDLVAWFEQLLGMKVFSAEVYFISYLPSQLLWQDVLMITSISFVLTLLSTLYPASRAAKIQPSEALRYE